MGPNWLIGDKERLFLRKWKNIRYRIMKFETKIGFNHNVYKCEFRTMLDSDVNSNYISELKKGNQFISNIPKKVNEKSQKNYINQVNDLEKDTICGLFVDSELIGTAGIQNISLESLTTIGIFLFDQSYRGQGFGKTMVWACCLLVNKCNSVVNIGAGMKKVNISSLNSFQACGFKIDQETEDGYRVKLSIRELQKPRSISNVKLELI